MEKRQDIEIIRIVCAFGIVWFHTSEIGKDIAYSALNIFIIISMYFSSKTTLKNITILNRAKRLLIPWMFWFLFYGVINIVRQTPFIDTSKGFFSGLLSGTSIHLWYLPFIFMAIVLFDLLKKYINDTELAFMCVILAILIFATTQFWRHADLPSPYGQYAQAFNSVLIGVFFANCYRIPKFIVAGCKLLLLASAIIWASNQSGVGIPYILSIIVMSIIFYCDWNINSKIQVNGLSECALGVYLSHPFWGLVIAKMHLSSGVIFTFLVFLTSGALIYLMKKYSPVTSKFII